MEFIPQLPNLNGLTLIDTHAHFDDFQDADILLPEINKYGVSKIITSGTDIKSNEDAVNLANKFDFVYASVGFHPELVESADIKSLEKYLNNPKVIAIGEIGLDYHYRDDNKQLQKKVFYEQIEFAMKHNLPIVVHDRDAHGDTLEILKKYKPNGTLHCFSGSVEMAKEIIKLGMFIGVGGVVTFKNARKLVEVVEATPIERILLETDAPYLAPTPFRGKRNHSAFLSLVAEKIAEIKNMSVSDVLKITSDNAINLYKL